MYNIKSNVTYIGQVSLRFGIRRNSAGPTATAPERDPPPPPTATAAQVITHSFIY